MTKIAAVKTVKSNTALWFNAQDIDLKIGDKVIVETSRGLEFGILDKDVFRASEEDLKKLKSDLKCVLRKASADDLAQADEMAQKSKDAMPEFIKIASETNKNMKPIFVEYLFDGKKAIFYFSAPERQDFRDLVKSLSNQFHVRIDMRQINEREKSAFVSGIGHCGQELCCARLGRCPKHVSIKQAKVQGLALNPENISGMCGKLFCCLDYEYEMYSKFSSKAPKLKGKVETPDGEAVVTEVNMPKETIELKLADKDKRIKVPLSSLVIDKKLAKQKGNNTGNYRPNRINKEQWDKAINEQSMVSLESVYTSTSLTGSEKLATGVVKTLPSLHKSNNNNKHAKNRLKDHIKKKMKRNTDNNSNTNSSDKVANDSDAKKHGVKTAKHHKKRHNILEKKQSRINVYENKNFIATKRRSRKISAGDNRPGQNSSGLSSNK